jgi:hypothetical protein
MDRRTVIVSIGGAALAWPVPQAEHQSADGGQRVHRKAICPAWLGHKIAAINITQLCHSAQERANIAVAW